MTDCHGLSEEETKMLLELELALSAQPRSITEVSNSSSSSKERVELRHAPKSKRNLGRRMRAVKEEEEDEREDRAASVVGFKIEMEYDADWTREGAEGSQPPHSQLAPTFCGSSDVSTAASSGGTALEDPQDPLDLDLVHACEHEVRQVSHSESSGRRSAPSRGQLKTKDGQLARFDSGYPAQSFRQVSQGLNAARTETPQTPQPKIRILARPVAAEEAEEKLQKQEPEDPWCTGSDPWSAGRAKEIAPGKGVRRGEGKGAKGRSRRGQAG
mmetsp:Transcript_22975/g.47669  ORF Transcript_22975/g.47669 Transcript_22975/m.47669 type:complete len:271 (-) Transcript_22975:10-822(-)